MLLEQLLMLSQCRGSRVWDQASVPRLQACGLGLRRLSQGARLWRQAANAINAAIAARTAMLERRETRQAVAGCACRARPAARAQSS
nr:hypothetical protein WG70_27280 [Burkholderia oklahomensis EO147]